MLNIATQDVQARFQAQGAALQQYTQAFLVTCAAIRVCFLLLFFILVIFRGGAPAHPLGVVPKFRAGC